MTLYNHTEVLQCNIQASECRPVGCCVRPHAPVWQGWIMFPRHVACVARRQVTTITHAAFHFHLEEQTPLESTAELCFRPLSEMQMFRMTPVSEKAPSVWRVVVSRCRTARFSLVKKYCGKVIVIVLNHFPVPAHCSAGLQQCIWSHSGSYSSFRLHFLDKMATEETACIIATSAGRCNYIYRGPR